MEKVRGNHDFTSAFADCGSTLAYATEEISKPEKEAQRYKTKEVKYKSGILT